MPALTKRAKIRHLDKKASQHILTPPMIARIGGWKAMVKWHRKVDVDLQKMKKTMTDRRETIIQGNLGISIKNLYSASGLIGSRRLGRLELERIESLLKKLRYQPRELTKSQVMLPNEFVQYNEKIFLQIGQELNRLISENQKRTIQIEALITK
ncbi:MAG: hypothetical protein Q7S21_00820 [archaeon]|nr:hypothetical protein [archaeon]